MTNVYFRTHAQKEYRKVKEMKSTSILNMLAKTSNSGLNSIKM